MAQTYRNVFTHLAVPAQHRQVAVPRDQNAGQRQNLQMIAYDQQEVGVGVEIRRHALHVGAVPGRDHVVRAVLFKFVAVDVEPVGAPDLAELGCGRDAVAQLGAFEFVGEIDGHRHLLFEVPRPQIPYGRGS